MKVTMKTLATGPEFVLEVGRTYNVGSKLGDDLVAGGYAEVGKPSAKVTKLPARPDPEDLPEPVEQEGDE